jgi:1-deoxy-D-xylulose-5-phosphate reductoisomerase
VAPLDLAALGSLTFEAPDLDTFACLRLAREAGEAGGTAPCILNAANEVAVHAFLNGRLRFHEIAEVIAHTLETVPAGRIHAFQTLYAADRDARATAGELVEQRAAAA